MGPRTRVHIMKKCKNETKFEFQGPVFILNVGMENVQTVQYKWCKMD